jgi:hypothetical protein
MEPKSGRQKVPAEPGDALSTVWDFRLTAGVPGGTHVRKTEDGE